jgi:precorrin-4/cobalt-precorrin-4 C11-methyltransferase
MPPGEDLAGLGAIGATLVLHLAVQRIEQVVAELLPHYGPDCPAAVVAYASQPREVVLRGTLDDIATQVLAASVKSTAVIIVGKVLAAEGFRDSHLYSPERERNPHPPSPF